MELRDIEIPVADTLKTDRRPVPDPVEVDKAKLEHHARCLQVCCHRFERWLQSGIGKEWGFSMPEECILMFKNKYEADLNTKGWSIEVQGDSILIKPTQ